LHVSNPHIKAIVDCVPKSNPANILILLCICSANQTENRTQNMVCSFLNNL